MRSKILAGLLALGLTLGVVATIQAGDPPPYSPTTYYETTCYEGMLWVAWYPPTTPTPPAPTSVPVRPSSAPHRPATPALEWVPIGPCEEARASLSSIRGTAFEDLNANGKRDANEPEMGGAWFKVSGGGEWFVCGAVGADATYGVPVIQPGATYFVDAIAPVGWKTTTPRVKAVSINSLGGAYLYNDLGFVRDPSVKTVEGCDQYHPVRR